MTNSSSAPRRKLEAAGPIPVRPLGTHALEVGVASTLEELAMCFAVRSAVYIGEQACPYSEEFDGNDHTATHILARVGGEPAATLRLRWFNGFFKVERVAVLKEYRGLGHGRESVGRALASWAFDMARRKGFTVGHAHARLDLLSYWRKLPEVAEIPGVRFTFSDHAYTMVRCDLEPDPAACAIDEDPLVMNRPEGRWHERGPLDASAERPAVNLHTDAPTHAGPAPTTSPLSAQLENA